jgi:hypothetical protein
MTEVLISCPSLANVSPWVTPGQQQENSILKRNVDFFSSAARFQNSLHTPPPLYNPNGLLFFLLFCSLSPSAEGQPEKLFHEKFLQGIKKKRNIIFVQFFLWSHDNFS